MTDTINNLINSLDNISSYLEHLKKSQLSPQYYSTAKPFYRFEYNLLSKELESANWNTKPLLIDIKCDGLRLSIGKVNGKAFTYVDPDSLKDKSPDVSGRLPLIIKELDSIPTGLPQEAKIKMINNIINKIKMR